MQVALSLTGGIGVSHADACGGTQHGHIWAFLTSLRCPVELESVLFTAIHGKEVQKLGK